MNTYTSFQMRELDRLAVEDGISINELMENAGRGTARTAMRLAEAAGIVTPRFILAAGKGNNGGDALVAARILHEMRALHHGSVQVCLMYDTAELNAQCRKEWKQLPPPLSKKTFQGFPFRKEAFDPGRDIIIDGLLGTGFSGSPRDPIASAITAINHSGCFVISIDLPSGLNADTGETAGEAVIADFTVTMAGVKTGMLLKEGIRHCGRIIVAEIGFRPYLFQKAPIMPSSDALFLYGLREAQHDLAREPFDTYKNRRGHVLVIGGSIDYCGAPFLTAESALRSGAGLVTVAVPDGTPIPGNLPRALIIRRIQNSLCGYFDQTSIAPVQALIQNASCLAIGPGVARNPKTGDFLKEILNTSLPKILDADALFHSAQAPGEFFPIKNAVITPHKGEFARLTASIGIPLSQENILEACHELCRKSGAVVLLKGPRTLVSTPETDTFNFSGCPALATAGSGDVLTGIIAGFAASGIPLSQCARLGAFIHGKTGELLAPTGSRGIIADDLPNMIPAAIRSVNPTC